MKHVLVTGFPRDAAAQMEFISEDGTTVICKKSTSNYPEVVDEVSAAVTGGTSIVACGGNDGNYISSYYILLFSLVQIDLQIRVEFEEAARIVVHTFLYILVCLAGVFSKHSS